MSVIWGRGGGVRVCVSRADSSATTYLGPIYMHIQF